MTRILVATRKGLFRIERTGGAGVPWKITKADFIGDNVTLVHSPQGRDVVLAALDHGHFGVKMQRSTDGGETFEECVTPAYPEKPEGLVDLDAFKTREIEWTTKLVWAFGSGTPEQGNRIWCGTIPGGLFYTEDDGDSWEFMRNLWDDDGRKKWFGGGADLPGIHSVLVDPRDEQHVTLGVSCGGVWETKDGGASWAQGAQGMRANFLPEDQQFDPDSQDPHCIVQSPTNPDVMWCQHHCGIFKTTQGCGHWEEIHDVKPSTFGFAVAVHPTDPQRAWFVPAQLDQKRQPVDGQVVVTRTTDGGKSFEVLREGLPQEYAYDLVYRHALDVDATGDRLAFGSTTGSLWVTEDQGDSFMQVSGHLPPVYAVRFVD